MKCPICRSRQVHPSARGNAAVFWPLRFFVVVGRCHRCSGKFSRFNWGPWRTLLSATPLIAVFCVGAYAVAEPHGDIRRGFSEVLAEIARTDAREVNATKSADASPSKSLENSLERKRHQNRFSAPEASSPTIVQVAETTIIDETPASQLSSIAEQHLSDMKNDMSRVLDLQKTAQSSKDLLALDAVNNSLMEIRGLVRIAENKLQSLQESLISGDIEQARADAKTISIAREQVSEKAQQAANAFGRELTYTGETEVEVDRSGPIGEDPYYGDQNFFSNPGFFPPRTGSPGGSSTGSGIGGGGALLGALLGGGLGYWIGDEARDDGRDQIIPASAIFP